jgi:uncharacterized protein YggE
MGDNTITVAGNAERRVAPEVATWDVAVEATDGEPRAAYDRCAEMAATVVERLKVIAEVETRGISVHPQYDPEAEGLTTEATTEVRVRAPMAHAADIAQAAIEAGARRIDGPELSIGDRTAIELDLLEEAVADARRRAERLASAAGRPLGRIVSIDGNRQRAPFEGEDGAIQLHSGAMPVDAGDLAVTARVTVVFDFGD